MPCPAIAYEGTSQNSTRWRNWAESVDLTVGTLWLPRTVADVRDVVQRAERENKQLHVVGAGYSFEDIATSPDWMVQLTSMNRILPSLTAAGSIRDTLSSAWLTALASTASRKPALLHVQGGIRLFDLCRALDGLDLALPTMGGSLGQHLVGAFSTSTHGSDFRSGPLCDLVHALHLVTEGGREMWLERASSPLTRDDAALRRALAGNGPLCEDLSIVRDDALFDAVLVGFGRFGIIVDVVIEVSSPRMRLAEFAQKLSWSTVAEELPHRVPLLYGQPFPGMDRILAAPPSALAVSAPYHFLDIVFSSRKGDECWVRRRWLTSAEGEVSTASDENPLCHPGTGNGLLLAVNAILNAYAGLVAAIPIFGLVKSPEILVRAAELLAAAANPHLTGGEALAMALNAIAASRVEGVDGGLDELVNNAPSMILGAALEGSLAGKLGPNWVVAAGSADPAGVSCYRANSIELVFPINYRDSRYLDFLNAAFAKSRSMNQAGYVSVRFTATSKAWLSMHGTGALSCSIEFTSLRGLSGNGDWMRWLENTAIAAGGRPHWGQQNTLDASTVRDLYGADLVMRWRKQLGNVVGESRTFSNAYTVRRGLEPATFTEHGGSWLARPGSARHIAVGPGGVFAIGNDTKAGGYGIHRFDGNGWQELGGGAVRVAVDHIGAPWVVNDAGTVFKRVGAQWQAVEGSARDIACGADGSIWAIGRTPAAGGYHILCHTGRGWSAIDGGAVRIAVAPDGAPWVLNDRSEIFARVGNRWELVEGLATDIGIGADGSVWVIGVNRTAGGYGILRRTGRGWSTVDGGAVSIAVDPHGLPWVVNDAGTVFSRSSSA
jgi:hypothetical protein